MATTTSSRKNNVNAPANYEITRSDASKLVSIYEKCTTRTNKKRTELERFYKKVNKTRVFANVASELRQQVCDTFFRTIQSLQTSIFGEGEEEDTIYHDANIKTACLELPVRVREHAYDWVNYLNWAVYNQCVLKSIYTSDDATITEDLEDWCEELNSCATCGSAGEDKYYYSTQYGLEEPVCQKCVSEDIEYIDEDDEDYEEEDDEDEDYEEEEEEEEDEEEDDEEDEEEDEEEAEEEEAEDEEAQDDEDEDDCSAHCDAEWRDGWYAGWKAAMRQIKTHSRSLRTDPPPAPRCDNCKRSIYKLKKCGGTCNGSVRYCSNTCQLEDWNEAHKYGCKTK